ncbi:DNA (cytosine-5-)-methyltransferase [Brevibacterium aurantiacum]|nr:DNA (cytosine-5-)-methyltransferase [Brevibacterium aurantiacum]
MTCMSLKSLEFFAGIGLARAGMAKAGIETVWANDYDKHKQEMYKGQFGAGEYVLKDVHDVDPDEVPTADIAWSSSPCTDLSLAGGRIGLRTGRESSAFFGFTKVLEGLGERRPRAVVLENVPGLASSHGGDDLRAAAQTFNELGYSVDVVALDARRWVPQSRQRLFMIGITDPRGEGDLDTNIRPDWVSWLQTEKNLRTHITRLPRPPEPLTFGLSAVVEKLEDDDPSWWDPERTRKFIDSMSPVQRARLDVLQHSDEPVARTAYRRTRQGRPVWEMRSDDISGCLRTARGGSSKQAIAFMGNGQVTVRWMTGREYARLMGAHDYTLTDIRQPQALYGFGDAVAVPVVEWVAKHMVAAQLDASTVKATNYEE